MKKIKNINFFLRISINRDKKNSKYLNFYDKNDGERRYKVPNTKEVVEEGKKTPSFGNLEASLTNILTVKVCIVRAFFVPINEYP